MFGYVFTVLRSDSAYGIKLVGSSFLLVLSNQINIILPSNTVGSFDLSSLSAWPIDPSVALVVNDTLLVLLMILLSFAS